MADIQPNRATDSCLETATLAAFVEGTLDPEVRQRVVGHLASCPDCSELVAEVIRTDEELEQADAKGASAQVSDARRQVERGRFWSNRRTFAAVGGLALAASLIVIVFNRGAELDPLVAAVGSARPILARPTGGFHHGAVRSPLRGSTDADNLQVLAEVARLRERAAQTNIPKDLHGAGVGYLMAGDLAASIGALGAAIQADPNEAAFHADLGAVYMTRFINQGERTDADQALASFDKALSLAPSHKEALFNKAMLLQRLNRPADAVATWAKYLALPDEQGWREEAIQNRDAAQRDLGGR